MSFPSTARIASDQRARRECSTTWRVVFAALLLAVLALGIVAVIFIVKDYNRDGVECAPVLATAPPVASEHAAIERIAQEVRTVGAALTADGQRLTSIQSYLAAVGERVASTDAALSKLAKGAVIGSGSSNGGSGGNVLLDAHLQRIDASVAELKTLLIEKAAAAGVATAAANDCPAGWRCESQ